MNICEYTGKYNLNLPPPDLFLDPPMPHQKHTRKTIHIVNIFRRASLNIFAKLSVEFCGCYAHICVCLPLIGNLLWLLLSTPNIQTKQHTYQSVNCVLELLRGAFHERISLAQLIMEVSRLYMKWIRIHTYICRYVMSLRAILLLLYDKNRLCLLYYIKVKNAM